MCCCSMTQVFLRTGDQSISHAVLVKAGEVGKEKGAATMIMNSSAFYQDENIDNISIFSSHSMQLCVKGVELGNG